MKLGIVIVEKGKTMTLSDLLLYLKVCGEATISVEDAKKLITCEDEGVDVKVLHLDPPINPVIYNYYGERKDNGRTEE
jgi:hypothetical protein